MRIPEHLRALADDVKLCLMWAVVLSFVAFGMWLAVKVAQHEHAVESGGFRTNSYENKKP